MFTLKNFANAVISSNSITAKVIGYTALVAVGIGADIISAGTKKAEVAEAPAPVTEEVADEDTIMEVIHDEDTVVEVIHDEDVVMEVVHEDPEEPYDDSADRKAEDELFEAAIKSTSDSFIMACEEAIELREDGNEEEAIETEKMAKLFLDYLHLSLEKKEECLMVHNAREALAAFRTFGPTRIEWM